MGLSARSRFLLGFVALLAGVSNASAQVPQTPTVTVGGLGYFQYAYSFQEDSAQKTVGSGNFGHQNNFDVTRAYINVIARLPFGVGARITPDIITTRNNTVTGLILRMKYAYVSWTPKSGASPVTFKFGEIQTPWLDWEEALWDYRMQGQMAMERAGYLSSSDLGISIDGNIHYDKFNWTAGFYDGENYSGIPGDSRKDLMARASFKIFNTDQPGRVGGFRITALRPVRQAEHRWRALPGHRRTLLFQQDLPAGGTVRVGQGQRYWRQCRRRELEAANRWARSQLLWRAPHSAPHPVAVHPPVRHHRPQHQVHSDQR